MVCCPYGEVTEEPACDADGDLKSRELLKLCGLSTERLILMSIKLHSWLFYSLVGIFNLLFP